MTAPSFGGQGYVSQESRALSSIAQSPDPDVSQGQEQFVKLVQTHDYQIKFLAQNQQQLQQGVNDATANPIQQIQQFIADVIVLLGGGELAEGVLDFGDLQYILPALGALFGFGDGPFPINLFQAAEHFFLGYVVPTQQFTDVINHIIEAWANTLGIDKKFIKDVNDLITAVGELFDGVTGLLSGVAQFFEALGIDNGDLGPVGQALAPIIKLFTGIDLKKFGSMIEFITDVIDPWIVQLTAVINFIDSILRVMGLGAGAADVVNSPLGTLTQPFVNLMNFLGNIELAVEDFNPIAAAEQFITNVLSPTGLLGGANWDELYQALTGITGGTLNDLSSYLLSSLFGPVNPSRLGVLPLSLISDTAPNLLDNPGFDNAVSIKANPDFVWDSEVGRAAPGSARAVADGTTKVLMSNQVPAAGGQVAQVSVYTRYIGVTAAVGANAIRLSVIAYDSSNNMLGGNSQLVDAVESPFGSSTSNPDADANGWVPLSGSYTVPASAAHIAIELAVTADASAGTVWFDDGAVTKQSAGLHMDWIAGLADALAQRLGVDVWQQFLDAVKGAAGGTIADLVNKLIYLDGNGLFDASKLRNTAGIPPLPNAAVPGLNTIADYIKQAVDGSAQTGNPLSAIKDSISAFIDLLRQGADGTAQTGAVAADAADALAGLRQSITAANTKLTQIISGENAGPGIVGATYVDEADRTTTADWGINWQLTGTGSVHCDGNNFAWIDSGSAPRYVLGRYTAGASLTDYQLVQMVMASKMESPVFGSSPNCGNGLLGRMNAAMDTFVYARIYYNRVELGCYVGGVQQVFATNNVTPVTGARWGLQLGTGDGDRLFQVTMNGSIVCSYNDTAAVSAMGTNYRYGGQAMWSDSRFGGESTPGSIAVWALSDNQPSGVIGTTFRAHRTSGTQMTLGTGKVVCVNGFYDTVDRISADLTYLPSNNCGVQVSKPGTYVVTVRVKGTGVFQQGTAGAAGIYKNGQPISWGTPVGTPAGAGFNINVGVCDAVFVTAPVYCVAGDIIQPGFWFVNFTATATGEATGTETFFEIVRVTP